MTRLLLKQPVPPEPTWEDREKGPAVDREHLILPKDSRAGHLSGPPQLGPKGLQGPPPGGVISEDGGDY